MREKPSNLVLGSYAPFRVDGGDAPRSPSAGAVTETSAMMTLDSLIESHFPLANPETGAKGRANSETRQEFVEPSEPTRRD